MDRRALGVVGLSAILASCGATKLLPSGNPILYNSPVEGFGAPLKGVVMPISDYESQLPGLLEQAGIRLIDTSKTANLIRHHGYHSRGNFTISASTYDGPDCDKSPDTVSSIVIFSPNQYVLTKADNALAPLSDYIFTQKSCND